MRKFILLLVWTLAYTCGFAQSPVMHVKSGSLATFKEPVYINVMVDDYNPIIDGYEQKAEDYYKAKEKSAYTDFCADLMRAHKSFITYYNEKKGALKSTVGTSSDYPYTLRINVTRMNVGNAGASIFGISHKTGGALIYGEMLLVENATNEVLCEIEFNGVRGARSPIFNGRAISVYRYLADTLLNIIY